MHYTDSVLRFIPFYYMRSLVHSLGLTLILKYTVGSLHPPARMHKLNGELMHTLMCPSLACMHFKNLFPLLHLLGFCSSVSTDSLDIL